MAASSGMRIGAIIKLKVDGLGFNMDNRILVIRVRPMYNKTKIGYRALASDEARVIVEDYINAYDIDGYLFPIIRGHVSYDSIQITWVNLLKKTGLNQKTWNIHTLYLHNLRKRFRTRLEGAFTPSQIL